MTSFSWVTSIFMSVIAPQTKYTNKYVGNSNRAKKGKCYGCATSLVDSASSFLLAPLPPKLALTTDSRGFLDKLLNFPARRRSLFPQLKALPANFSSEANLRFHREGGRVAKCFWQLRRQGPTLGGRGIMITLSTAAPLEMEIIGAIANGTFEFFPLPYFSSQTQVLFLRYSTTMHCLVMPSIIRGEFWQCQRSKKILSDWKIFHPDRSERHCLVL